MASQAQELIQNCDNREYRGLEEAMLRQTVFPKKRSYDPAVEAIRWRCAFYLGHTMLMLVCTQRLRMVEEKGQRFQ